MKAFFAGILLMLPILGFSQFKHSEFYLAGRFGIGMGMNSYTYFSDLDGTASKLPSSIQIELGSGLIPEIGVGLKVADFFYFETSVTFAKTNNFYTAKTPNGESEQGYSFNRYAIQLNAKYFVPVNEKFVMDFYGGLSITIPQELVIKIGGYTEVLRYGGSNGMQGGFAGNYIMGPVTASFGIRYRLERFTLKEKQTLPNDFKILNPSFDKISSSGIDVLFTVIYNF
jgi:hypothetical protein